MISLAPTDDSWETVRVVNPDLTVLPVRGSLWEGLDYPIGCPVPGLAVRWRPCDSILILGEGDLINSGRLTWRISCSLNSQSAEEDWLFSYATQVTGSGLATLVYFNQ